jgi:hypothetical protein
VVLSAWLTFDILQRTPEYRAWLRPIVAAAAVASLAGLVLLLAGHRLAESRRRTVATAALGAVLVSVLIAPAAWAQSTLEYAVNGVFPGAGPSYSGDATAVFGVRAGLRNFLGRTNGFQPRQPDGGNGPNLFGLGGPGGNGRGSFVPDGTFVPPAGGSFGGGSTTALIKEAMSFAAAQGSGTRFLLIVGDEQSAAPVIIETGEAVASMGGFTGRETVLTPEFLSNLVGSGEARYFLLSPSGGLGLGFMRSRNAAAATIAAACDAVPALEWSGSVAASLSLYDCAGKGAELGAAR